MMLLEFLASVALTVTPPAEGGHTSNGGKVVVCRDQQDAITSIELFDYHEGRLLRGFVPDLGAETAGVDEKIETVLARWQVLDAGRAARYREWTKSFASEAEFLTRTLPDIPDLEPLMDPPPGCTYEQMVLQRAPRFPGDKRYFVNKTLFDSPAFKAGDKAGLILHEVIYREAIGFGADDSIGVRYLNSLFAANAAVDVSLEDYLDRLVAAGLETASVNGVWLDLKTRPEYHTTGSVAYAQVVAGTLVKTPWGDKRAACKIMFTEDGVVTGFNLARNADFFAEVHGMMLHIAPQIDQYDRCKGAFDVALDGGNLEKYASFNAIAEAPVVGPGFNVLVAGRITFEGDRLVSAETYQAADHASWVEVNGERCFVDAGVVTFKNGELSSAQVQRCRVPIVTQRLFVNGRVELAGGRMSKAAAENQPVDFGPMNPRIYIDGLRFPSAVCNVDFFPGGDRISALLIEDDKQIKEAHGVLILVLKGSKAHFDENGALASVDPP